MPNPVLNKQVQPYNLNINRYNNLNGFATPQPDGSTIVISSGLPVWTGAVLQKLGTVNNISMNSTGITSLYTVPTGRTAVVRAVTLRCIAGSGVTNEATISIGVNTTNDIIPATQIVGFKLVNDAWLLSTMTSNLFILATAGQSISLDVVIGATSTSVQFADADLIGYLV